MSTAKYIHERNDKSREFKVGLKSKLTSGGDQKGGKVILGTSMWVESWQGKDDKEAHDVLETQSPPAGPLTLGRHGSLTLHGLLQPAACLGLSVVFPIRSS